MKIEESYNLALKKFFSQDYPRNVNFKYVPYQFNRRSRNHPVRISHQVDFALKPRLF